jgi:transcriptional regulator
MYRPDHFNVDDVPRMHALMRANPFATLVSAGAAGLVASHLPTVLKDEGTCGAIECHVARPNPHWKDLGGGEALMIFQGAQGYITPNWYPSKAEGGKVVPTWNYAAVHAYGRVEIRQDADWLLRHVTELTAQQERDETPPWAPSDAPPAFIQSMLRGIVGLHFVIARLEGKWKMSQNRGAEDRAGVVQGLERRGRADDRAMADLIGRDLARSD